MPSVRTPRLCSQRRRAPVTTASTTSLTVPPSALLIRLNWPRSARTHSNRRCDPTLTLSGTSGAGLAKFQPTSPTASTASETRSIALRGCSIAYSTRRRASSGARATASASLASS